MPYLLKDSHIGQVLYLGRWVDKSSFRAFVYDKKGNQKLAESYQDFESLTASGIWFAAKPVVSDEKRKQKDVVRADG